MKKLKKKLRQLKTKFELLIRSIFVWFARLSIKPNKKTGNIDLEYEFMDILGEYIYDQLDTEEIALNEYLQSHGHIAEDPDKVVWQYCFDRASDFLDDYLKNTKKNF